MVLNTAITRAFSHRSGHHLERHLQEMASKGRSMYFEYLYPKICGVHRHHSLIKTITWVLSFMYNVRIM